MKGFAGLSIHIDKSELAIGLAIVSTLGILALWKKRFATKAEAWPTIAAKIENVFVVSSTRGVKGPRYEVTNAVLAYSYSIGGSFFSGEIKLMADDSRVETIEKELVGQQVTVHYNPKKPKKSIFLKHRVRGWSVVEDPRISVWSWLDNPR
jgi:Protein of unknown function (DUF3592)